MSPHYYVIRMCDEFDVRYWSLSIYRYVHYITIRYLIHQILCEPSISLLNHTPY